jgi:pyruvate formate lyase activating enzyme
MMEVLVGFKKTSLVDYPGKVAATIFVPGCNLRCPWCHNRELVETSPEERDGLSPLSQVLEQLQKRKKVLSAVVITGGEPTLRSDLGSLVEELHRMGFLVKLDTNGTLPDRLEKLFSVAASRPDYVALDLKVAPQRYGELLPLDLGTEAPQSLGEHTGGENLKRSANLLVQYRIPHEFRTLVLPRNHVTDRDLTALAPLVDPSPWYFSAFRGGNCLDPRWNDLEEPDQETVKALAEGAKKLGKPVFIRVSP